MKTKTNKPPLSSKLFSFLIILYTISFLAIDFLISIDAKIFSNLTFLKMPPTEIFYGLVENEHSSYLKYFSNFDTLKFLTWLILPLCLFHKKVDSKWFTIKNLSKLDLWLTIAFSIVCILSLGGIIILPSLSSYYPGMGHLPLGIRLTFFIQQIFWLISWLPGWEFLNRHLLLRASEDLCKDKGWIIVPIVETLYHLSKPLPEIFGMLIFSILATLYTQRRKNNIPPFLCHLIIELGLVTLLVSI